MTDQIAICIKCSSEWRVNESRKNHHRLCRDCRRTEERKIDYGFPDPCIPWNGDFDQDDNPMKNGMLYRPGQRICNHKDCVQKAHIVTTKVVTPEDLIAEQFSLYYRTKKRKDYSQLMATLEREKRIKVRATR